MIRAIFALLGAIAADELLSAVRAVEQAGQKCRAVNAGLGQCIFRHGGVLRLPLLRILAGNPLTERVLRELRCFVGNEPQSLVWFRKRFVHVESAGVHGIADHAANGLRRPNLIGVRILRVEEIGSAKRSVALVDDQIENLPHNGSLRLVDLQVIELSVLFAHAPLEHQTVAVGHFPSAPDTVSGHLAVGSLDADGGFLALAAGLPEPNVVDELVASAFDLLLPLTRAPDLNAVIDEPLNQEGRFIFPAAQPVEHEHQQNVEFLFLGKGADVQNGIAVFSGYLVAGYALFHTLVEEDPVLHPVDEGQAFAPLHGNVVRVPVNLPFGRYSVQAKHSFHDHCSFSLQRRQSTSRRSHDGCGDSPCRETAERRDSRWS